MSWIGLRIWIQEIDVEIGVCLDKRTKLFLWSKHMGRVDKRKHISRIWSEDVNLKGVGLKELKCLLSRGA